jgi:3-phenylpropionate/trans-cinnamate dioxygenase ferredoxin component
MEPGNSGSAADIMHSRPTELILAGRVEELPPGRCATVELPNGSELALYNVNGELYATANFCPHKGALLAEGSLCGYEIECAWHGWVFDVRSGRCLTVGPEVETYRVVIDDDLIKIEIPRPSADDAR